MSARRKKRQQQQLIGVVVEMIDFMILLSSVFEQGVFNAFFDAFQIRLSFFVLCRAL